MKWANKKKNVKSLFVHWWLKKVFFPSAAAGRLKQRLTVFVHYPRKEMTLLAFLFYNFYKLWTTQWVFVRARSTTKAAVLTAAAVGKPLRISFQAKGGSRQRLGSGLHGLGGRPLTNCSWYSATAPDDAPKAPLLLLLAKTRQVLRRRRMAWQKNTSEEQSLLSSSAWYYTLLCPENLKQAQRALTSTRECILKKGIKKEFSNALFSLTKL